VESASAFEIAVDRSLTYASIATSFGRSGLEGSPVSRQTWNLDQSLFLTSRRSVAFIKGKQYPVSISIGN
jgi:hypothetical protein